MNSESENMYHIEIGIIGSSRVIRTLSMEQYKANVKYADICYGISCRRGIFEICEDGSRVSIPDRAVAWVQIVKDEEQAD